MRYRGFASKTWMSTCHSRKSSALTRSIPGGSFSFAFWSSCARLKPQLESLLVMSVVDNDSLTLPNLFAANILDSGSTALVVQQRLVRWSSSLFTGTGCVCISRSRVNHCLRRLPRKLGVRRGNLSAKRNQSLGLQMLDWERRMNCGWW